MRKVIAAFNMSLDGICDHNSLITDDEIHEHYNELLRNGGVLLYGRITYQLMEDAWPALVKKPSGNKPMDDFALSMQDIPKIAFSHTLKKLEWENARLAQRSLKEEILALKQEPGKDIMIGSRSLIIEALNQGLVDEFQLCVQPVIVGSGMKLFENIEERIDLKLIRTKTFGCVAVLFYYSV